MSIEATRSVWARIEAGPRLTSRAKLVLLALADFENSETRQCNPSVSTLRHRTRLPTSTINLTLLELVAAGDLRIEPGGGRTSNRYQLTAPRPHLSGQSETSTPDTSPDSRRPALRNDTRSSPTGRRRTMNHEKNQRARTWQADPNCIACGGDGFNSGPNNTHAACLCRTYA